MNNNKIILNDTELAEIQGGDEVTVALGTIALVGGVILTIACPPATIGLYFGTMAVGCISSFALGWDISHTF